jgi:hypothetical protein
VNAEGVLPGNVEEAPEIVNVGPPLFAEQVVYQ